MKKYALIAVAVAALGLAAAGGAFVDDGIAAAPEMIAPSFVGRSVPAGRHVVRFVYEPFPRYDLLLTFGALSLL